MRFILIIFKFFFIILFLSVFSCSDKEVRPFVGKKIDIHISNKYMSSKNFLIEIDQVIENDHWVQKGGNDNHSVSNMKIKFPLKLIFSHNTDQELSDKYSSLHYPEGCEEELNKIQKLLDETYERCESVFGAVRDLKTKKFNTMSGKRF